MRNKPGTLLKYEHLSEVLQTLNLDNKKPFFGRSFYIVTASVYVYIYIYIYISDKWVKDRFQDHYEEDQHADNV